MLAPTVLDQDKLLIRLRKMLFHVEQNAVSRETDLIRTECCSNAQPFERCVIRMARPSLARENKKGGSLAALFDLEIVCRDLVRC
jgi:hypothetical protein